MESSLRPSFKAEQQVVSIGGVKIGGRPGDNPVLLIGTMFHRGDKLWLDEEEGRISWEKADSQVSEALSMAEEYGVQLALDAVIPRGSLVEEILSHISEYGVPVLIDSPDPEARVKAYRLAGEMGVQDRMIANGIAVDTSVDELEAIREAGIKAAILLAFDPRRPYESLHPQARLKVLGELLPKASRAEVTSIMVDAVVLDPGSIALSAAAVKVVKDEYGLPSGCAPANALGPVSKKRFTAVEVAGIHGGTAAMLRMMGADFIMYGPLRRIKYVAPAAAMVDAYLGYLAQREGERIPRNHPSRKILRRVQKLFVQEG